MDFLFRVELLLLNPKPRVVLVNPSMPAHNSTPSSNYRNSSTTYSSDVEKQQLCYEDFMLMTCTSAQSCFSPHQNPLGLHELWKWFAMQMN